MPIVPLPLKPAKGQPWLNVGDAWYDNVAQFLLDVPALQAAAAGTQTTLDGLNGRFATKVNPVFTGTVTGVTKAHVGLGNVENLAPADLALSANQVTSGTLPAARLPALVAAIRVRTPENEAAPTANNWQARPSGYPLVLNVGAPPAPADADPADLHVALTAGTGTETGGTTFAGLANGAAWPAPWVVGQSPTGGGVTVQGARGELKTGNTVGNYSSTDAASARHSAQSANFTIVYTWQQVDNVHCRFVLRCDSPTLDPQDGIIVSHHGSSLSMSQVAGWVYTSLGSAAKTWTKGVDYKVKITANGSTVQAKAWLASATEPAAWDVTATVTRTASGYLGFWAGTDAAAASQRASYDAITVTT